MSGSSHTSELKIGNPVAALPGVWRYGVSAGICWPCVSILSLGEIESFIYSFYLCMTERTIVSSGPSLRYTSMRPKEPMYNSVSAKYRDGTATMRPKEPMYNSVSAKYSDGTATKIQTLGPTLTDRVGTVVIRTLHGKRS